ncbi:MAG: polysaccharide pyruvyl transferase family protein [Bilifractor sp.]|jgi:polysaccharide pyruvyl transferase WcaK-like protein
MKISVIAFYYEWNLGDAVIGDCVKDRLQRAFPEAEVGLVDLFGRTAFPKRELLPMELYRALKKRQHLRFFCEKYTPLKKETSHEEYVFHKILPALKRAADTDCDAVVFAGGQIFADTLASAVAYLTSQFTQRSIPVYFVSCGAGAMESRKLRQEMRTVMHHPMVRLVTVRDHPDLISERFQVHAVQTWDQGLWASETYPIHPSKNGKIGLGIMYPFDIPEHRIRGFYLNMIAFLEQNHIDWCGFTNGSDMDEVFAREILQTAAQKWPSCMQKLLPCPENPAQLTEQIASFRGIISLRLHSHIISAAFHVPAIGINWDDKVRDFYSLCGLPERCVSAAEHPEKIWQIFGQAEREGWPVSMIQEKRAETLRILTDKMRKDLPALS